MKRILLACLFGLTTFLLPAQEKLKEEGGPDTLTIFYTSHLFGDSILTRFRHDTLLHLIHRYWQPDVRRDFYSRTATNGRRMYSLEPRIPLLKAFDTGLNAYEDYLILPERIKRYSNKTPFTEAKYVMGSKKEQMFDVVHAQQPFGKLSIGANYRILDHPGMFYHEKTFRSQAFLYAGWGSAEDRYSIDLSYYTNRFDMDENGGLVARSDFTSGTNGDRQLLPVNLVTATSEMRLRGGQIQADFALAKPQPDSLKKIDLGRVFYRFDFRKTGFSFTDEGPLSLYYPMPRFDFSATSDTIGFNTLQHSFGWSNFSRQKQRLSISIQNSLHSIRVRQLDTTFRFTQNVPEFALRLLLPGNVLIQSGYKQVMGNVNAGDYEFHGFVSTELFGATFYGRFAMMRRSAPFTMKRFESNHYHWNLIFDKENTQSLLLGVELKKTRLEVLLKQTSNMFVLYTPTSPSQFLNNVPLLAVRAEIPYQYGLFESESRIIYQHSQYRNQLLGIPEIMASSAVWFNLSFFRKALVTQIGLDLQYISAFNALAYNPVTMQFNRQLNYSTGNTLIGDVFINARISRALLFLKYQHVNAGLMGYSYFLAPDIPMYDRGLAFGVKWMFYN